MSPALAHSTAPSPWFIPPENPQHWCRQLFFRAGCESLAVQVIMDQGLEFQGYCGRVDQNAPYRNGVTERRGGLFKEVYYRTGEFQQPSDVTEVRKMIRYSSVHVRLDSTSVFLQRDAGNMVEQPFFLLHALFGTRPSRIKANNYNVAMQGSPLP